MDQKDSKVQGGLFITHKIHEGKHQYEVENVVKCKRGVQGSRLPVSKESVLLRFHMEMWRKGDLEESKPAPKNGSSDNEGIKKSGCKTDDAENGKRRDLVVVSMKKTSIAVVRGRGCTSEGCSVNEVVLVAQSSKVTLVSRGSESFKQEKSSNVMIQHVASHYYLSLVSEKIISASPNPERITIYSYKTNEVEQGQYRGMPVVLNFTDSDCFLRCCQEDQRVFLQAEVSSQLK
ncbi:unnamed protein product [Tetraodon nigroviridis]|uniref:(spotted green pufferfish) hypothetical protein n=1 Tax=Tetraodon nigroviridis TaxID=99883 RepID=Q4SHQ9_TETNG|nr:unnamed protein product [Tetraodon nigroviridis]